MGARPVDTVFVGGGTPSLLGAQRLGEVLDAVRSTFGLAPGAEVTTESNPESTSPAFFAELADGGLHAGVAGDAVGGPARAAGAGAAAHAGAGGRGGAGGAGGGARARQPRPDLRTPGETDDDLRASLDAVLAAGVDHVSAYALIVEDGTALARRVARGELPAPDDDVAAARYELIDDVLSAAGLRWYEVSNWAASAGGASAGTTSATGSTATGGALGPGAHSHLAGARWWNVKHPARYAALLAAGESPEAGREELTDAERATERVMLRLRLASGLAAGAARRRRPRGGGAAPPRTACSTRRR